MTEMGDAFREQRRQSKRNRELSRRIAEADFYEAADMAKKTDMDLTQCTEAHYQLTVYLSHGPLRFWLYNLYPGNQRIYADPNHKGPFLRGLKVGNWTFEHIIVAANRLRDEFLEGEVKDANNRGSKTGTQEVSRQQ